MKKCAKVVCHYFGPRRLDYNTPLDLEGFFYDTIETEVNIDNGMPVDLILCNNLSTNDKLNKLIQDFNGKKTKNGEIIVEARENIGGSFGAYYDMYKKYHQNYDYWFFSEDDVLIYKENYIKIFVDYLESNEKIGFVCLAPLSNNPSLAVHSGGGVGLSSTKIMQKVYPLEKIDAIFSGMRKDMNYNDLQNYEIYFTNEFTKCGYEISNHPDYSTICSNYSKHLGQRNYATSENLAKEIIYKVGP